MYDEHHIYVGICVKTLMHIFPETGVLTIYLHFRYKFIGSD